MAKTADYYQLLGVPRNATPDQIRSAYRKLAKQHHPDVGEAPDGAERFKQISEAYEVLSDPERRQRYDMFGGGQGLGDFGIGDLFETFFGSEFRRREPRGPMRGADLRMEIEVELIDAVRGGARTIRVPRLETCERCEGSGAEPGSKISTCATCSGRGEGRERRDHELPLDVPAGIDDGQQLRVAGEGEAGLRGGPSGDLYVLIRLREHAFFRREGDDLVHVLRISPAQAALGADLEVPTIEGATAPVKVPGGAQHGQMVRLRGKGVPHLGSSGRGDQLVYLDVAIPRTLTKEQKALYRQLHDIEGAPEQHDEGDARGVFDRIKDAMGGE